MARLLGRDAGLPDGCRLEGAEIRQVDILARYRCGEAEIGATVTLLEADPRSSTPAGRLVLRPDPGMPPALVMALEARLAGAPQRPIWIRPDVSATGAGAGGRPRSSEWWGRWPPGVSGAIGLAVVLGVVILAALARWGWRRRAKVEATRERSAAVLGGAALGLVAGAHGLLLGTGLALAVLVGQASPWSLGLVLLLWVAGLGLALLGVSLLRGVGAWRRAAWVAVVATAYLAAGLFLARPPPISPGLGGLLLPFRGSQVEQAQGRPKVTYRHTQRGFREPEFESRPAPGVRRVVLIGDSFVFGSGVPLEGTLSSQLARALDRPSGPPVEVLNLGVPGSNLASYVDLYEAVAAQLAPEVVVICLVLPNDLSRWDVQAARREALRTGPFSLARLLLGGAGAQVAWDLALLEQEETPEGLDHLRGQLARLRRLRTGPSPRLLFFHYAPEAPEVDEALGAFPGAVLLAPDRFRDQDFIPGDGHPSAEGNAAFARILADRLAQEGWLTAP